MPTTEERARKNLRRGQKILFSEGLIIVLSGVLILNFIPMFSDTLTGQFTLAVSVAGVLPVIWRALTALLAKRVTIDLLAGIAVVATLLHGDYLSAVFINLMLASAEILDLYVARRTGDAISLLLKLRPAKVKVKEGDSVKEIPLEKVKVGDSVVIEAGERVPVDGAVISGTASLNQSALTGESALSEKTPGSPVYSATLVEAGSLLVRAERVGDDTTLAKIIALVDEASRAKTKTESIANRFSVWYIVSVLLVSGIVFYLTRNITLILGILLVTCADDIAVAIPLGFTVAIAKAARHGIVIKGAAVLERLREIKIFVTDKTGTLTRGITQVAGIVPFPGVSEGEILAAASVTAAESKHPMAQATVKFLKEKGMELSAPDEAHEVPGFGLTAKKSGHTYAQGKTAYLLSQGIRIGSAEENKIKESQAKGESVTVLSLDGRALGFISFADSVRSHARGVIEETRRLGVRRWFMLTGDNEFAAERVAKLVGVDKYFANLKPEEKLSVIEKLKGSAGAIAMLGDGVNDAPALALADVSFAMGAIGSDAAIETADIALMHDDLKRVPEAMLLSRETLRIVKQNFAIWAATNVVGLVLVFTGVIGPVGAAAYNFLTDFLPIMNVFRIWFLRINRHAYEAFEGGK